MTTQRAFGYIVLALVVIGGAGYVLFTVLTGRRGRGSEIELAPNRKPYLDDEELETTKLDRALMAAVGLFILIGVLLPLYWLAEPGRQAGAVKAKDEKFVEAGQVLYETGAQCIACHGPQGTGGQAQLVINDEDGNFINRVTWKAPALNTVLWRFSEDEVRYILNYGRPGSPMQPWGVLGGGPYNTQQLEQIIDYLWSIQLSEKDMRAELDDSVKGIDKGLYDRMMAVRKENEAKAAALSKKTGQKKGITDVPLKDMARLSNTDEKFLGEILFNLDTVAGGAFDCARCHVPGAAYGEAGRPFVDKSDPRAGLGGYSAMAPRLNGIENGSTEQQHFDLVMKGTEDGKVYFTRRIGSGKMPGFGLNPSAGIEGVPQKGVGGMYSPEQVISVVTYERSLSEIAPVQAESKSTAAQPASSAATQGG